MAGAFEADPEVSVRQLLALARLQGASILGGRAAADKRVRQVRLAPEGRHPEGNYAGAAVVLDGSRLAVDNYVVDLALRWMEDAGAPLLIVLSPADLVGLPSRRLADRLEVGLIALEDNILDLTDHLREVVEGPTRVMARTIVDAVDRLGRASSGRGVQGSLAAVDATLDSSSSSLVGVDGAVIVGPELNPPLERRDRVDVAVTSTSDTTTRIIQPVTLTRGERPTFWLVVQTTSPTHAWCEVAAKVAQLASSYIATRLISDRLEQERDARVKLGALNSILALSERPSSALLQQLGTLGWKTDGWCTALHLRLGGSIDSSRVLSLTGDLAPILARAGVSGPIVERPDGWTSWLTAGAEPPSATFADLVVRIRRALQEFVANRDGVRIYAGIGRPYPGVLGLKTSLAEAQDSATIAQASGMRTAVQHIDELGVQRILVGWYTSQEFSDFARTLLRPIMDIDSNGDLMRTLEVFLDQESSPTTTADILGVHRNTIIKRITRIREVLPVDLEDADQRLAVELACRVVNITR